MKSVTSAFLTMLQSNDALVEADLYTITLLSGTVLYYTSAQQSIVYNGNTYLAAFQDSAPGFHRGQWRCTRGLDTDELEVDLLYDASTRINGIPPAAFANFGGFDGAQLRLDKALAPNWENPVVNGVVNLFVGVVGECKSDAQKVSMTISSMLLYLQTTFPRNYFLTQCNHCLFDSGCGLSASAHAFEGVVTTATGAATVTSFNSNLTSPDGYFSLGYIVWTSGDNLGAVSSVKGYLNADGAFQLIYPLTAIPNNGDTFTAFPGCDKTQSTCTTKFSNIANFRGYPFVPTPETLEVGGTGSQPPTSTGGGGGSGLTALPRGPGGLAANFKQQ
jgi:uncharacterized phage protein (TIGR02218 family)